MRCWRNINAKSTICRKVTLIVRHPHSLSSSVGREIHKFWNHAGLLEKDDHMLHIYRMLSNHRQSKWAARKKLIPGIVCVKQHIEQSDVRAPVNQCPLVMIIYGRACFFRFYIHIKVVGYRRWHKCLSRGKAEFDRYRVRCIFIWLHCHVSLSCCLALSCYISYIFCRHSRKYTRKQIVITPSTADPMMRYSEYGMAIS